jgi:hypothetical protein
LIVVHHVHVVVVVAGIDSVLVALIVVAGMDVVVEEVGVVVVG